MYAWFLWLKFQNDPIRTEGEEAFQRNLEFLKLQKFKREF